MVQTQRKWTGKKVEGIRVQGTKRRYEVLGTGRRWEKKKVEKRRKRE
jgi:hypothetical protein